MSFTFLAFRHLAFTLKATVSGFFTLGGRFFVLFVVDVFYNLHNLAVSAFGLLTADFTGFHK